MDFPRTSLLPNTEENKKYILPNRKASDVWCNIIKVDSFVKVVMNDGKTYLGQCKKYEPFEKKPLIVLACWQEVDKDGVVITDNSNDPNKVLILNSKHFERIEVTQNNK